MEDVNVVLSINNHYVNKMKNDMHFFRFPDEQFVRNNFHNGKYNWNKCPRLQISNSIFCEKVEAVDTANFSLYLANLQFVECPILVFQRLSCFWNNFQRYKSFPEDEYYYESNDLQEIICDLCLHHI